MAEDQEAEQHRQPAGAGDQQRLHRGAVGPAVGRRVADQQPAEDGGQFPADVEQQQVIGGDDDEHRCCEAGQQHGEGSEATFALVEVPGAVGEHERADAADEQNHQQGQGIQAARERQTQLGYPADHLRGRSADSAAGAWTAAQTAAEAGTVARARNARRPNRRTSGTAMPAASRCTASTTNTRRT